MTPTHADPPPLQRVQRDLPSNLPLLDSLFPVVRRLLESYGYLGVIVVDLQPLAEIETECGAAIYNKLIGQVSSALAALQRQAIRASDLLCTVRPYGEAIAIFLEGSRSASIPNSSALGAATDRVWAALAPKVAEIARPYGSRATPRFGYALALANPMVQAERLIYRAIDQARVMALDYSRLISVRGRERLRDVIVQQQLHTVFQPIIDLAGGGVRGYEGLIRGPAETDLATPALLFKLAAEAEVATELDRACCECTLAHASGLPEGKLLFANVLPSLLNDESFRAWLGSKASTVDLSRVVLELNEGVAIRSYDLLAHGIQELRARGVRIAVDDLGAGYANLDHVLRLKPDFLKLDISLVRGVHDNPVKQALIGSLVSVGRAVGATVIGEGVEEPGERDALSALGVAWAQGYLYARPAAGFAQP